MIQRICRSRSAERMDAQPRDLANAPLNLVDRMLPPPIPVFYRIGFFSNAKLVVVDPPASPSGRGIALGHVPYSAAQTVLTRVKHFRLSRPASINANLHPSEIGLVQLATSLTRLQGEVHERT